VESGQSVKSTSADVWTKVYLSSCAVLFATAGIVGLKIYEDSMRSHERGRLVSSIVDQQYLELSGHSTQVATRVPSWVPKWNDDSLELKRWVVQESFAKNANPAALASKLDLLSHAYSYSGPLEASLSRWKEVLARWAQNPENAITAPDKLLEDSRQHFFEAVGYNKIGRPFDATILHLWTIGLLTRFIEMKPFDPGVPEALYMLGVSYLELGDALPHQMRGDRILNLCSELYPDSLWASRSNAIWRETYSNEV
jgi:hypothetical protein